jgi:hypothetical protein
VTRRVRVRGIRREALDTEALAYIYAQLAKRQVQEKRRREEAERTKRQCKEGRRER